MGSENKEYTVKETKNLQKGASLSNRHKRKKSYMKKKKEKKNLS